MTTYRAAPQEPPHLDDAPLALIAVARAALAALVLCLLVDVATRPLLALAVSGLVAAAVVAVTFRRHR